MLIYELISELVMTSLLCDDVLIVPLWTMLSLGVLAYSSTFFYCYADISLFLSALVLAGGEDIYSSFIWSSKSLF
jgi:hypothetical protein